jgi:hypothetical protein
MRISTLLGGFAILFIAVVALLAILNFNYRSTVSLSPASYTLIGLAVAIAVVGSVEFIRRDSNPQTGFTPTSNIRRNRPLAFLLSSLLLVGVAGATAAAATWHTLKVVVPHVSGPTLQTAGVIESMTELNSINRSCNVLASIRLQTGGLVVICYEWGVFWRRRISDDDLSPGAGVTTVMVTNLLGTAVTSVALVK